MSVRDFNGIAMELALLAAGHKFPRLSEVGAAWGEDFGGPTEVELTPPTEKPLNVDCETVRGFSIFLLDITLDRSGNFRLIEANGSNAALSSSIFGKDDRRARHMYLAFSGKTKPRGQAVVLLPYAPSLIHIAEFFGRAGIFAERVAEHHTVRLCGTDENLGREEISIVCGRIPEIARFVAREGSELRYRDRPVVFSGNPNILPELVRRGVAGGSNAIDDINFNIFHEGICTPIVHDKGLQQDLASGTGIAPLKWRETNNEEEAIACVEEFHREGKVAVGKMNAGSGGAGIEFFPLGMDRVGIESSLSQLMHSAVSKYGDQARRTLFPIRFFEFARSTNYELYGQNHLWDLRLQCLLYPGYVEITPCVIRLCRQPFDDVNFASESVISNLTGRDGSTAGRFLRSPAAMRRSRSGSVLDSIGITTDKRRELVMACAAWCQNAWRHSEVSWPHWR